MNRKKDIERSQEYQRGVRSPESTNSPLYAEPDPNVKGLIRSAQVWTVVSWCTYPIVYTFPMMGISGPSSVVATQLGYPVLDTTSEIEAGMLNYQIANAKLKNVQAAGLGIAMSNARDVLKAVADRETEFSNDGMHSRFCRL